MAETNMMVRRQALAAFVTLAVCGPATAQEAAGPAGRAGPEIRSGEAGVCTDAPDQVRLRVAVSGVRNADGMVVVTVYGDKPGDFLAPGRKLARIRLPAKAGVTETCLAVPARASYAIAVYHDENGDQDFNRSIVGLPTEGYGFSRDAPTLFGLPGYDAARFTAAAGDQTLAVPMHYR